MPTSRPAPLTPAEKSANYRNNHKDRILQQHRDYYNRNREAILQYQRQYRQHPKHQQPITCACGLTLQKRSVPRHINTVKHQLYLERIFESKSSIINDKHQKLRTNALINLKNHYEESKNITDKKQNKNKWRTIYAIIQKYKITANEFNHIRDLPCNPSSPCNTCRPINNNHIDDNDDDDI